MCISDIVRLIYIHVSIQCREIKCIYCIEGPFFCWTPAHRKFLIVAGVNFQDMNFEAAVMMKRILREFITENLML